LENHKFLHALVKLRVANIEARLQAGRANEWGWVRYLGDLTRAIDAEVMKSAREQEQSRLHRKAQLDFDTYTENDPAS
jgi:hypothetical protein